MDRRRFFGAAAALPATVGMALAAPGGDYLKRAATAALALQRRDWEQGVLAQAFLEAGDRTTVILLAKGAILQREPDGRLAVVTRGNPTDPAMGGEAYARAADWTGEAAMREGVTGLLDWIRHTAPRSRDGILSHTFDSQQMWSDGFHCAPPFLAAMGFVDEALQQIEGYRRPLWDADKKLLHHIWNDDRRAFRDGRFWGGGMGWAAAGLARVLRHVPASRRADRAHLVSFAKDIIDGTLAWQRPDGLFHDTVDQPDSFVETNLAQMLAYAIYDGVAAGWLEKSYGARAETLRRAALAKMDANGFVQGVCSAPRFDRPGVSTEGQAFTILMEAARTKR